MDERRRSPRAEMDLQVVIHYDSPEDVWQGHTADLSAHGVFLKTMTIVELGTTVFLDLDVGDETIALDGVVVRVSAEDPVGLGVEFTGIGEQVRARLLELTQKPK